MEFSFITPWGGVSAAYNEVGLCRLDLPQAEQRVDTGLSLIHISLEEVTAKLMELGLALRSNEE